MSDRQPVVAGQFYPAGRENLKSEVERFLVSDKKPSSAIAVMAPHAGYMYSGAVAGAVFASVIVPKKVIVLSPNHTGLGRRASIMTKGNWIIPTGKIPIAEKLASEILQNSDVIEEDVLAHSQEHSLEVQLPFLLARNPEIAIVPITIAHIPYKEVVDIGKTMAAAIKNSKEEVLIVASTDMNHYQSDEITRKKDKLALDHVLKLDAEGLLRTCAQEGITMCGVVPVAVAIEASKILGAKKAELVKYATSGDSSGDYSAVVGYAGIVIRS